jgi:hypothetical protein
MRVNEESAASGRFVASASPTPRMSNKKTLILWFGMVALLVVGLQAMSQRWLPGVPRPVFMIFMYGAPFAFMAFQMRGWLRFNKKIAICVTGDDLTVDRWPGEVFSFSEVKLGPWNSAIYGGTTVGTALHLRCGAHRFVIGGRDHRTTAGTRLEAPPVEYPDAYMSASDFDELLTVVGRRSGLGVRRPALGEPTRCLLVPSPAWFFSDTISGSLAALSRPFQLALSKRAVSAQPTLAIDVNDNAVWVIDPNTNTVIASAPLAQVTATPAKHTYYKKSGFTAPVMVVHVPGLQERLGASRPLTITCRDARFTGTGGSISWCIEVHEEQPAFVVSGADWLALVEKFGLAPYLQRRDE